MFKSLIHRSFSIALAAFLTAGMLGGINQLSQPGEAAPGNPDATQWAQHGSSSNV